MTLIYSVPPQDEPIRQCDIFVGLPRMHISLKRVRIVGENGQIEEMPWTRAVSVGQPVAAVVGARPVTAIVVTQDCDALRAPDITLCEIREFRDVERKSKDTTSPRKWMGIITQHARINQKWFYLPRCPAIGFEVKMAVDFLATLCLPRIELGELKHLRAGRLNEYAEAHFRERVAHFYRRYPYDEWYALDNEEMAAYRQNHPDAEPYPWQAPETEQEG